MCSNNFIGLNRSKKILALTAKNKNNLKFSASGGAFMVFARAIIEQGGVVFGCVMDNDGTCYHKSARTHEELKPMQGSKYVHSSIRKTYEECVTCLNDGYMVLFSGTPCQIYYLYQYLDKNNVQKLDNLITVDLFCHGTPPQKLFKNYIKWLENKHNADSGIFDYTFRSKLRGWGPDLYYYSYLKNNKKYEEEGDANSDPYYFAFLKSWILMEKCYHCEFSSSKRVGDFSIGDFWGIENSHKDFYDRYAEKGISAVLINTEKAMKFFEAACSSKCIYEECLYEEAKQYSIDEFDYAVQEAGEASFQWRKKINIKLQKLEYDKSIKMLINKWKTFSLKNKARKFVSKILPKKFKSWYRRNSWQGQK